MRAFVMKGIGKVGFADKPIPTPGPTDADRQDHQGPHLHF